MFEEPDGSFRPVPWWCWSGEMDYPEMEKQLQDMKDKGINEFFIFAIYGLEISYLGKEWWKRVEWTLKRCKELGMKVWIYDDYNWPSGTCAGYVLRDYPWTKTQRFKFETFPVKAGKTLDCSPDGELIAAVVQFSEKKIELLKIDKFFSQGKFIWENNYGKDCKIILFAQKLNDSTGVYAYGAEWCSKQTGYLDTLNKKAVEKFIQSTHVQYEKRFKEYFGNTLKGFFTDEPQVSTQGTYYSSSLFSEFKKKYDYDLKAKIHELLIDTGDYQVTHYHFWSLLTHLFAHSYTKQISDWCEKRKLLHTGHLLGEERLFRNVVYSGDVYEALKWMQVPGMDLLGKETSYDFGKMWSIDKMDRRGLIITAKLISSTARFTGRERTMCEAFGILDWGQTMEEQKWVNDWLSALGINLINDNTLIYTIKGFRKRAISGKHFTSPWWKYYKQFTDYSGRLSLVCAKGKLEAEIGVLYPTTNAWCLMRVVEKSWLGECKKLVKTENALYAVSDALLRTHRDFELLFDEVITNGSIKDGCLVTQNGCFKTIILPGIEILRKDVYARLKQFVEAGGKLIIVGRPLVSYIDVKEGKLKQTENLDGVVQIPHMEDNLKFESILASNLPHNESSWIISGRGRRDVISAGRKVSDGRILFLANQSSGKKEIKIGWKFHSQVSLWDPDTGKAFSLEHEKKSNVSNINLTLAPHQSLYLFASEKREKLPLVDNWPLNLASKRKGIITLRTKWNFETETSNLFIPQFQLMSIKNEAKDKAWVKVTRYGKTKIELSPENMDFFRLRSEFILKHIPEDLSIVVDSEDYEEIWLNGKKLTQKESYTLWDSHNLKFPVKKHAKTGSNLLTLKVKPSKYYSPEIKSGVINSHFIEPVVVSGSFMVAKEGRKEVLKRENGILQTGSWTKQGYPYFAGAGVYSQKVELNSIPQKAYLEIEKAKEVVEVWINKKLAGIRPWSPYVVEISEFLKEGENQIDIKVVNSFGNLLQSSWVGRPPKKGGVSAGILGKVKILDWQ